MREIKFRVWDKQKKFMIKTVTIQNLTYKFASNKDHIFLQYTGLKDKNGKEIYEGDIVYIDDEAINVVFEEGAFKVHTKYDGDWLLSELDLSNLEVIGNIYENPELLKGDKPWRN